MHRIAANIITITGSSGAGKSSIAKRLLELMPKSRFVVSLTTRRLRPTDLPGEILHVTKIGFSWRKLWRKFLWAKPVHGNHYGTLRKSVDDAFALATPSLMLLMPETVPLLRNYAVGKGTVLSFYILSPSEEELRRRFGVRGDDSAAIERRISDCKKWDKEAKNSGLPYIFVSCEEPVVGIEKAAREVLGYLQRLRPDEEVTDEFCPICSLKRPFVVWNPEHPRGKLHVRYDLFPQIGAYVPFIDCRHCNFRNSICSEQPAPKTRLSSRKCMNCGCALLCPECKTELEEGLQTELDAILFCPNEKCGLWFQIW